MFQLKKWSFLNNTRIMKKSHLLKYISLLAFLIFSSDLTAQTNEHVNIDSLIQYLKNSGVKTYTWSIDQNNSWEDLKNSLPKLKIAGISINIALMPPSVISPSVPFDFDFIQWAKEIANLSLRYSNIKSYLIEDLKENINLNLLSVSYIESVKALSKAINPKLDIKFLSTSNTYYVSNYGNDSNTGLSPDSAWATTKKVNSSIFYPGDSVLFKRGDSWIGENVTISGLSYYPQLYLTHSGISSKSIYFGAYGTGNRPYFKSQGNDGIGILVAGSYIIVDNLNIDSSYYSAMLVWGHNVEIKNCELEHSAEGIILENTYGSIHHNYIHDLITNNLLFSRWGAIAVNCVGQVSNSEIYNNLIVNAIVEDWDCSDGGFVDFNLEGEAITNIYIHHNIVNNANDFFEFTTSTHGSVSNITWAYNSFYKVDLNNDMSYVDCFVMASLTDITYSNLQLINNTIYDNVCKPADGSGLFSWNITGDKADSLTSDQVILTNNIIVTDSTGIIPLHLHGTFGGSNNIFYRYDGSTELWRTANGFTLTGLGIVADPLFSNISTYNFRPSTGSPAIGAGIAKGYITDLLGNTVSSTTPTIGAYEKQ